MALTKDEIGGSNRAPNPFAMSDPVEDLRRAQVFAAQAAAMRNAQRAALMQRGGGGGIPQEAPSSSGGSYGNYSSDLDRLRELGARAVNGGGLNSANPAEGDEDPLLALLGGGLSDEDISGQAAAMFKPQFDYLAQLEAQARNNAGASDKKLADLYAALQRGYKADQAPVGGIYDKTGQALTNTYDEGVEDIGQAQEETAARTAAMMRKLGIEQAGPELFKENVADAQKAQQRLISQKTVDLAGNTSSRGAAMNDLIVKGQAAGLQGADRRSALQSQLMQILSGYGGKKADLMSEQAKASFDIRSNAEKQRQDALKMLMEQEQRNFMNEDVLHDNRLADEEFKFKQTQQSGAGQPKLSPFEEMSRAAAQAYGQFGTGQRGADNGIKAITDAARYYSAAHGNQNPKSAQDFINYVRERNPNATDIRILMDLANRYYDTAF